jgi:hypothetical protein
VEVGEPEPPTEELDGTVDEGDPEPDSSNENDNVEERFKIPDELYQLGLCHSLDRDIALSLRGLSGLKIRTIKSPHAQLLFSAKPGENVTQTQAATWPHSRWCLIHISQSVDRDWEHITSPEAKHEARRIIKRHRDHIGECLGLVEFGRPIPDHEAKQIPRYASWVRDDNNGWFLPRLRFTKFREPFPDGVVNGKLGFVNSKCTQLVISHLIKGEQDSKREVKNVDRPEHIPLKAKFSDYHGWGNHDMEVLTQVVSGMFPEDPSMVFKKFLTTAEQAIIPALVDVREEMTGQYCRRNIDILQARYLKVPSFPVGKFDEEITMIKFEQGRVKKFIENRNAWFPSKQSELRHLKVDGISALHLARAAKGAIHLGAGAESPQAEVRTCVQECFHLLGYCGVRLPDDTVFRSLPQKLSHSRISLLAPSRWPFKIEVSGNFNIAISQLIECATQPQWFILQVHLVTGTSLHCVCIKNRMIADPAFKEWLPLSQESFSKLGIDRVVFAFMLQARK